MILKFCTVCSFVLVITVLSVQVNSINYEYKKENSCDNINLNCPTFTKTNIWIMKIISNSSVDFGYKYNSLASLKIINSYNLTEISANNFPRTVYTRRRIISLDLSANNIQKILPGTFTVFTSHLIELNLTMNSLTALDNYLSPLLKLQKINISQNNINTISDTAFANLLNIFVVDLSFNNISHIPENTFSNQKYLEQLLLQGNRIKEFDLNFPKSGEHITLDLSHNLIETVLPPQNFLNISLSHNNITVFSPIVSSKLQRLDLSYNYIKVISTNSFLNAVELQQLNLSHNLLSTIPTSSFKEVTKLQYLDLSHNLIHENSYTSHNNWNSFFLNFKQLKKISLEGNYWKCSDLKDFIYLITSNRAEIIPGNTNNTTNIHRIRCIGTNNTTNNEITFNPSERIQSLINQKISEEIKSLYLNFSNEWKVTESLNSVKSEITKLKMVLNSFNATNVEQNELVKAEILKLKVALNTTLPNVSNLALQESVIKKLKSEISELNHPSSAEGKIMERTQSSGNSGVIITNICLVIVVCCLVFLIYVYYKNRRIFSSVESERLNLE